MSPAYHPVHRRDREARHEHVRRRLAERAGLDWPQERVAALEKKIRFVRSQVNNRKPCAPILPTKLGEDKAGTIHYYRALIAGQPHTFVWSQRCRGLISYRGPGELTTPHPVFTPEQA